LESRSPIHGLTLIADENDTSLVVANQDGIECWSLNLRQSE
jgi:hypothetical protein